MVLRRARRERAPSDRYTMATETASGNALMLIRLKILQGDYADEGG